MRMLAHSDECLLRRGMHLALPEETEEIAQLEARAFPPDEKATAEGVAQRQREAGEYFWTLGPMLASQENDRVLGFVNGTCTSHSGVTEESMETHEPEGSTLIIHSVVIDTKYRRQGLASAMLQFYLERMRENSKISRILLISKGHLLGFYSSVGFEVVRLSPVVHGKDPWFEMSFDLTKARRSIQHHVDAFATESFKGNQAGVVFQHYSDEAMQQLAAENKFAETSFVERVFSDESMNSNVPEYNLRWFTPTHEIALCGHATVAAAHALFERGLFQARLFKEAEGDDVVLGTIKFQTKFRGILIVRVLRAEDSSILYEMSFPSSYPTKIELGEEECHMLITSLHISKEDIIYSGRAIDDIVVELNPDAFQNVPTLSTGLIDFKLLNAISTSRGIIITCSAPEQHRADFLSRFFCPKLGVDEDPVTGSAHCQLAPYWFKKLSSNRLVGYQNSERGGYVTVSIPDNEENRVLLSGHALTVMTSEILCEIA